MLPDNLFYHTDPFQFLAEFDFRFVSLLNFAIFLDMFFLGMFG